MAQIKAAFFDIDGTLLPFHAKALPESTVQALAALQKKRRQNVYCHRPPDGAPAVPARAGRHPV